MTAMIEELKNNIQTQIQIVRELASFVEQTEGVHDEEKKMIYTIISSLKERMKIIGSSNTELIRNVSYAQPLPGKEINTGIERMNFKSSNQRISVKASDKERYLKELSISESLIKKFMRKKAVREPKQEEFKKANLYAKIANRFFFNYSTRLIEKKYFENLNLDLRKGNINVLTSSYVSMMFFTTVIAGFVGVALFAFLFFFDISTTIPYVQAYSGSMFQRLLKTFWVVFLPGLLTFIAFYFYPYAERSSLSRRIDSELPFVVIHMGSISGSGVEPTQIFKIVGLSKEYPSTRGEIRKLLNQINVYGYDLITALKNVARLTPSQRLAEVLNGLSTTISSGGDLKTFFEKRAETLLLNYRLEREKFTKVAETFMDIYISVVIATPMILLLLLVMISVSGVQVGLGLNQMTLIIILVVAVVNIIFLWLLSMKQPAY